jgi:pyruvate formate lyase activating enzyme
MHQALFWKRQANSLVLCELCPRECKLSEGQLGACGVRKVVEGKLYAMTYAHPCSLAVDPVEKKPLFHFHPGEPIFSLATIGCNLFCSFCQNWQISKRKWDVKKEEEEKYEENERGTEVSPAQIIKLAKERGCRLIAFTYTEPTIYYEYMLDIAKLAKKEGMECVIVSNGYINDEPLQKLIPFISAANIDLKGGKDFYKKVCKVPDHEPIKKTIIALKRGGVHVEVTTLIIPGENDTDKEIEERAMWLAKNAGKDTPLHFSAFHPDYKMQKKEETKKATLLRAKEIAKRHLDYVYIGNVAGVDNNTYCATCDELVIERTRYAGVSLLKNGACPKCKTALPGRF